MDHQFSKALSTMFLRRLVMFLHFETYVFENPQKPDPCRFPIYQLDFLPHIKHSISSHVPSVATDIEDKSFSNHPNRGCIAYHRK